MLRERHVGRNGQEIATRENMANNNNNKETVERPFLVLHLLDHPPKILTFGVYTHAYTCTQTQTHS